MLMFPTRGRPWALKRFIDNYKVTGATLPVTIIVDTDNMSLYEEVWHKHALSGWILFPNKSTRNLRDAMNSCFEAYPHEKFYGMIADDVIPMTDQWDVKLMQAAGDKYIAWGDDTIWGSKLPTHPFIGGDLVRAFGWFSPPYTDRHCADFIWKDFADALGLAKYCGDVIMEHRHWQKGTADFDSTYAIQPSAQEGHVAYHDIYKGSDTFESDVERVKEKLGL